MEKLKISTAQFEHKSGDKLYNLEIIEKLSSEASKDGSKVISFHECSITGYTFAKYLTKEELIDVAEYVPDGPSTQKLIQISKKHNIVILAGLFEKDDKDNLYNTYLCVDTNGLIAKHRKLHPFISKYLTGGDCYTIFDLFGWKCGILICYDNNIIENVRATTLLGAQLIFMPHVTMLTPSTRPGSGFVDQQLWFNRFDDPTSLRLEFDGIKGRQWLLKWLPARAYDNAIYLVFSNPIGIDYDQVKNGCSMIIDPFGDIIDECRKLDNDLITVTILPENLRKAGGFRYKQARRPDLYKHILNQDHQSTLKISWIDKEIDS